jgi:hypothetical protein
MVISTMTSTKSSMTKNNIQTSDFNQNSFLRAISTGHRAD